MTDDRLIVALDVPDLQGARKLLKELEGVVTYFKIGFELFTAYGWDAVALVKSSGAKVFLDLKLHDIPNTVARTAAVICDHEVDMFNVHALGGVEMMQEVRKVVDAAVTARHKKKPLVIAVTILTSHNEENLSKQLGIAKPLKEEVLHLARMAQEGGLDGVVCSPQEIQMLRQEFQGQSPKTGTVPGTVPEKGDRSFIIVTPGIRPAGSEKGDQKRTFGPREAIDAGSSYIVVGRPITAAPHPREAAIQILNSL